MRVRGRELQRRETGRELYPGQDVRSFESDAGAALAWIEPHGAPNRG